MVVLVSVFTSVSIICTAIRVGARRMRHQLGLDDLFIVLAVILAIVQSSFNILRVHNGFGQHEDTLSDDQIQEVLKWTWYSQFFLFLVLPLTKISICFLILRTRSVGWLKWFLYGLMTGLVLTNGLCIIILLVQCRPLHAYWNRSAGTCGKVSIYNDAIWVQVGKAFANYILLRLALTICKDIQYCQTSPCHFFRS